ncbi:hypothetical protein BH23ACT10_BH23ACT10_11810 [soil metagenome]
MKPAVTTETDLRYTNAYLDEEIVFAPTADELVVTFDTTNDTTETLDALSGTAPLAVDADRGFAIVRASGTLDDLSADLADDDAIANSLPVLRDGDGAERYVLPDEFCVQFTADTGDAQARAFLVEQGAAVVRAQRTDGYFTVAVPNGTGLFETMRAVDDSELVEFVEPSEVGLDDELTVAPRDLADPYTHDRRNGYDDGQAASDVALIPADPRWADLYGLRRIRAHQAWDIETGSRDVVMAVIDTGCDLNHPDLTANLLPRGGEDWDFADPADAVPDDEGSHGTHVAGTTAAVRNREGVVGVAPGCRIMPLRVRLISGFNQNRADAINYVAGRALTDGDTRFVINCSWRMSGNHAGVLRAIRNAVRANVVVVFAAGNDNRDIDVQPQYPAVYPEVIAVAATDADDERAGFSNFGTKVDVAAPGVSILSTIPDDTYGRKSGTSMAAPHVAGLAGLIWSWNPTLTNAEVRRIIERTCDTIDGVNPGFEGKLGRGRINALRALRATPAPPIPSWTVRTLPFPQANAGSSSALTYIRRIWIPGRGFQSVLAFLTQRAGSERVHYLHPRTGAVIASMDPQANDTIGSMAWDGSALRVANVTTGAGVINRINPLSGAQLSSIPAPQGRGEGLASVGGRLYYSTINTVHVLSAGTGAVLESFPAPGANARGLTSGQGLLFMANANTDLITVVDRDTRKVRGTIAAPSDGNQQVEAIAFDSARDELYVANQARNIIEVLQLQL